MRRPRVVTWDKGYNLVEILDKDRKSKGEERWKLSGSHRWVR